MTSPPARGNNDVTSPVAGGGVWDGGHVSRFLRPPPSSPPPRLRHRPPPTPRLRSPLTDVRVNKGRKTKARPSLASPASCRYITPLAFGHAKPPGGAAPGSPSGRFHCSVGFIEQRRVLRLKRANQITSPPVEPLGNSTRLPIGARFLQGLSLFALLLMRKSLLSDQSQT